MPTTSTAPSRPARAYPPPLPPALAALRDATRQRLDAAAAALDAARACRRQVAWELLRHDAQRVLCELHSDLAEMVPAEPPEDFAGDERACELRFEFEGHYPICCRWRAVGGRCPDLCTGWEREPYEPPPARAAELGDAPAMWGVRDEDLRTLMYFADLGEALVAAKIERWRVTDEGGGGELPDCGW